MSQNRADVAEHMSYEFLELLRDQNPAWRLLTYNHSAFASAFLFKEFILENRRQISEQELIARLDDFKFVLQKGREEMIFPRTAQEYLNEWADDSHGWLRKFYPAGQDEPHFDVTSNAQKAIEWLLTLRKQTFIGTESRLITVFELLRQIAERSEEDPESRILQLERQKEEIEREIEGVREGRISLLDDTQIKERFWQAMTTAREVLADFRAVEQNLRELDRDMRERIAVWNKGKGELLGTVFNEQDGIVKSEQGKSFAAFWKFLMSPSTQDDFQRNLEYVLNLKPVQDMEIARNTRGIHRDWINAGAYVQETVAMLSQQLRRYVDESYLEEERRIVQLVREIEGHALAVRTNPPKDWDVKLDALKPEISLAFDRPLFYPPQKAEILDEAIETGTADIPDEALYSQIYVDKEKLKERISGMLQERDSVTLNEVVKQYPMELGLGELITYLVIAGEQKQSEFSQEADAEIFWIDEEGRKRSARTPEIIFHRNLNLREERFKAYE